MVNMKKRILLFIFVVSFIKPAFAQITKNNWLVGGIGIFNSTTYNSTSGAPGQQVTHLQLSPDIGYFLFDKFAIGLKLGFESWRYQSVGQNSLTKNTTYSFGPFVRYYLLSIQKEFNLLIEGNYQHGIERGGGSSAPPGQPLQFSIIQYNKNTFSIAGGPVIYFNSSVGLEFLIGYSSSKYAQYEGNNNTVQVGIGLQIHLEKDKK